MAIQICPKCKEESFVWSASEEYWDVTDWHCGNCGYDAREVLETVCESCGHKTRSFMKDDSSSYWWCSSCNAVTPIHADPALKIREELAFFLKHGHLKHVSFGISRTELTSILGETSCQHFTSRKDRYPSIYKYGRFEFYFNAEKKAALHGIQFHPLAGPGDDGNLTCNYHRWTKRMSIEKSIAFLNARQIAFEEKPDRWNPECRVLMTEGGVTIFFDDQRDPGKFVLHKAGKFI